MDSRMSIPRPTLDQPFAIELWPHFDTAFARVMGHSTNKFVFIPGETPLSTLAATSTMLVTYYVTVFAGREFMKNREPFKLNGLFMAHNLILTILSGSLLALFIEQLLPTLWRYGTFYAICNRGGGWTPPLVLLYYVRVHWAQTEQSRLTILAQLSHQILRATRQRLYGPQEEAPQYVHELSSRQDGANNTQPSSTPTTTVPRPSSVTRN